MRPVNIARLHKSLVECYSLSDLRLVSAAVGAPPDDIVTPGRTLAEAATELIAWCQRRGMEDGLLQYVTNDPTLLNHPAVAALRGAGEHDSLDLLPPVSTSERVRARDIAPEGIVTIFFSDIEGFSSWTKKRSEAAAKKLLDKHNELMRRCIDEYKGYEVKTIGDSFMVTFPQASPAVLCALSCQAALRLWTAANVYDPIWIRVGMATGSVTVDAGDYSGDAVNTAARIAALAKGGETLVSKNTKDLVGRSLAVRFVDNGSHSLKGLKRKHRLFFAELPTH